MNRGSLLTAPLLSFFSRSFYRDVGLTWRATSYLYLFLVLAVCWVPSLVTIYHRWTAFMTGEAETMLKEIPAVSITNGVVSTDAKEPHFVRWPESEGPFAIIDTTGEVSSLDGTGANMLLTRNQLIVKKNDRETRIYDLSAVKEFAIDRERVRHWLTIGSKVGPPIVYLFALVFSYLYRVCAALILAAIGQAFRPSLRFGFGYAGVASIAVVAMAPAVMIQTASDVLGIWLPFRELLILGIAFAYMYIGLKASRSEDTGRPPLQGGEMS